MELLITVILIILGIITLIGIIRVMFSPYTGILNLIMEIILLDLLFDVLFWIFESIGDLFSNDF